MEAIQDRVTKVMQLGDGRSRACKRKGHGLPGLEPLSDPNAKLSSAAVHNFISHGCVQTYHKKTLSPALNSASIRTNTHRQIGKCRGIGAKLSDSGRRPSFL